VVTLTIDEKEVSVEPATTILEAAKKIGIEIPTLCYHPKLDPIGSCRLCVVEIEGIRDPMAACNTPVKNGIKVTTQS
jgi:formate dehydrogenase alpha subunit